MKSLSYCFLKLILVTCGFFTGAAKATDLQVITAVGADSMQSLMSCWRTIHRERQSNHDVKYLPALSVAGGEALMSGLADIALYAREPFPNEVLAFGKHFGVQPEFISVAGGSFDKPGKTHAIAIFVNANNPISSISVVKLRQIYASGATTKWGELGLSGEWEDEDIVPYGMLNLRASGNPPGIVNYLQHKINGGKPLADNVIQKAGSQKVHALQQITDAVANNRFSIGYSGFGFPATGTKTLAIDMENKKIKGTENSVRTQEYPLSRTVYVAISPQLDADKAKVVHIFIDSVLSKEGQNCVHRSSAGFTPLPPEILSEQSKKIKIKLP